MIFTDYIDLLALAQKYGVKDIHFGGCCAGKALGFKGAMRRSAHAHCVPTDRTGKPYLWYGHICIKSGKVEKLLKADGKPNRLFWHEVSHIYRNSRSQKDCNRWAYKMVRFF